MKRPLLVFTFLLLHFYWIFEASAQAEFPALPDKGVASPSLDSFYDPMVDYGDFPGRVTDIDRKKSLYKIKAESKNVKFFRAGDLVRFRLGNQKDAPYCKGVVRDVENFYFVLHVEDLHACWSPKEYFRRGTQLSLKSEALAARVKEASRTRVTLLQQREDFLKQLNSVNHFLWTYDQQRMKKAAEYEQKMVDLAKEKEKALNELLSSKKDNAELRKELSSKLDEIKEKLKFYRVERQETLVDRWYLDRDLGLPVGERPQEVIDTEKEQEEPEKVSKNQTQHRWHQQDLR